MLSYLRLIQTYSIRHNFKIQTFAVDDYKTMCHLLKERYLIHNEDIKIFKDIKLLDENNKLVGIYPASEARKKALNLKKDITLVNSTSDPVICRVIEFRNNVLNKFFQQIVYRHNEKLLNRANSIKQLKIALNLNQNQLKVKGKQIIQLAKKNLSVRVYMNCKNETKDECLQKLEYIKSEIQSKCIIDKDIKHYRNEQEKDTQKNSYDFNPNHSTMTFSFTCKSRENQFVESLKESSEKAPDEAIKNFLKKYYKQQDVEMLDLKATGELIAEEINVSSLQTTKVDKKSASQVNSRTKGRGIWKAPQPEKNNVMQREAKARILNQRLKVILGWAN